MKQVDIKKVHRIHEKDAPCWYGLSFDPKGVALILLVHKKFIEEVGDLNPVPEYIQRFKDGFGFTEFSVDFMSTFGFDKAFEFTKDDGEFIHLKAKLPKVRFHSDNPCERCSGSGKSELQIDRSCPHCGGVGFAYEVNSKSAYAISASLTFFHMVFGISDIDTGCNMPQLMNMQSVILKEPSGASLGGEFSAALLESMKDFGESDHAIVIDAMKRSYKQMWKSSFTNEFYFRFCYKSHNSFISIDCPGDASGIYTTSNWRHLRGKKFDSHNVDSPVQQLTLLCGLATIQDLVRERLQSVVVQK